MTNTGFPVTITATDTEFSGTLRLTVEEMATFLLACWDLVEEGYSLRFQTFDVVADYRDIEFSVTDWRDAAFVAALLRPVVARINDEVTA